MQAPDATADTLPALVIYHHNCADGFSAAWCFHHHYSTSGARPYPEFVHGRYGYAPPDVTGRDVYLVDFSYKRQVVEQMLQQAASVTLIDHHKTALEDLADLPGLRTYTDLERSGATLAWDYLFPGQQRQLPGLYTLTTPETDIAAWGPNLALVKRCGEQLAADRAEFTCTPKGWQP